MKRILFLVILSFWMTGCSTTSVDTSADDSKFTGIWIWSSTSESETSTTTYRNIWTFNSDKSIIMYSGTIDITASETTTNQTACATNTWDADSSTKTLSISGMPFTYSYQFTDSNTLILRVGNSYTQEYIKHTDL